MSEIIKQKGHEGDETERKKQDFIIEKLNQLFWKEPVVYLDLCRLFQDREYKLNQRSKELLVKVGAIKENGDLPLTTCKALRESNTIMICLA